MQLQSRQRANRRHPVVAEEELVLDDQPPAGVEQKHAVIAKPRCEYLVENAERVVNPQRIGGLPEAHTRDVEGWPALDQQHLHPSSCEACRSRKSANAGSDHENTSNIAHSQLDLFQPASATHSISQPLPNRSCIDQAVRAGGSIGKNSRYTRSMSDMCEMSASTTCTHTTRSSDEPATQVGQQVLPPVDYRDGPAPRLTDRWRQSRYSAADQPPFRRRKHRPRWSSA